MSLDMTETGALDDAQRATLAGLADELVPSALGMPAASEVDVHVKWIDRALKARPDLVPVLIRVLDAAAGEEPAEALRRLNEEDPDGVGALGTLVTGAYYLHPKVRKLIGYPGQKENPALPDEAEHYLGGGILDPVIARGPIYRSTPA
jgi:hypothetical protein